MAGVKKATAIAEYSSRSADRKYENQLKLGCFTHTGKNATILFVSNKKIEVTIIATKPRKLPGNTEVDRVPKILLGENLIIRKCRE